MSWWDRSPTPGQQASAAVDEPPRSAGAPLADRRAHERILLDVPGSVTLLAEGPPGETDSNQRGPDDGNPTPVTVVDLSEGGVRLRAAGWFRIGATYRLTFTPPMSDEALDVDLRLLHIDRAEENAEDAHCQFLEVPARLLWRIVIASLTVAGEHETAMRLAYLHGPPGPAGGSSAPRPATLSPVEDRGGTDPPGSREESPHPTDTGSAEDAEPAALSEARERSERSKPTKQEEAPELAALVRCLHCDSSEIQLDTLAKGERSLEASWLCRHCGRITDARHRVRVDDPRSGGSEAVAHGDPPVAVETAQVLAEVASRQVAARAHEVDLRRRLRAVESELSELEELDRLLRRHFE